MQRFDVFNGDADGLCALQQLRLAEGSDAHAPDDPPPVLVTGVKRHIRLLEGLTVPAGSLVTVLDVGFTGNRRDVERLLDAGCTVRYFDHHHAGEEVPTHPRLETHLTDSPQRCTSLLVERYLGDEPTASTLRTVAYRTGVHRNWAVVGAFGDNLTAPARRLAGELGLQDEEIEALQELGELLNYNGYGDAVEDLHFHPARLFEALSPYADPRAFAREAPEVETLRGGFADDWSRAEAAPLVLDEPRGRAVLLPDAPWARRIQGVLANRLTHGAPDAAHAVAVTTGSGDLRISVRTPLSSPESQSGQCPDAGALCRRFPSGGGRVGAGGINALPSAEWEAFLRVFRETFG